jgi:L-ascorbate metabolism protein UlaG (beta-lactamase superfamily)
MQNIGFQTEFYWIGGATFILTIGNLKIAVDPVLCEQRSCSRLFLV